MVKYMSNQNSNMFEQLGEGNRLKDVAATKNKKLKIKKNLKKIKKKSSWNYKFRVIN